MRRGSPLPAVATPLFLSAAEIGPHSGRHPGNFPQPRSHLALINAAMHLIRADEKLSAAALAAAGAGHEL
jgi:alpha,alpha-trehalase